MIVTFDKNWVDHRTLSLSMRVYGYVNQYVIDAFGRLVLYEQSQNFNSANPPKPSKYIMTTVATLSLFYLFIFFVLKL